MGRWYYRRKATADACCKLEMPYIRKRGMFSGVATEKISWINSKSGKETAVGLTVDVSTNEPNIRLVYTITDREGNKTDYDYMVSLLTTSCNFGGIRYWFGCPSCGRRVAVLYLAPGDIYFKCRHCNNLSYWSRNRCKLESWGHFSREIDKLRGEIKRWTWRGRPTRKVRKLQALERKEGILTVPIMAKIERLNARLR